MEDYNVQFYEYGSALVFDFIRDVGRPTSATSEAQAKQNAWAWFANKKGSGGNIPLFISKNKNKYTTKVIPQASKKSDKIIVNPIKPMEQKTFF